MIHRLDGTPIWVAFLNALPGILTGGAAFVGAVASIVAARRIKGVHDKVNGRMSELIAKIPPAEQDRSADR